MQRVGKLTPHQARLRAEERADEAEARARAAERETARLRAALSKERASRGANGSGTALYQLRAAVLAEPGAWTPARVRAALDGNTSTVRVPEARRLLGQLADEGSSFGGRAGAALSADAGGRACLSGGGCTPTTMTASTPTSARARGFDDPCHGDTLLRLVQKN